MFERFTDRARRAVSYAQEEARALNHNYIGTEHLLLGVLREEEGIGAKVLVSLGVPTAVVRDEVLRKVGPGATPPGAHIPFTPRAKKVLEGALREAVKMAHNYIGTEHLLLGLLRVDDGLAARILAELGLGLADTRRAVIFALQGGTQTGQVAVGEGAARGWARAKFAELAGKKARGAGPACAGCQASLITNTAYRVVDVPDGVGEGLPAKVLFVYCTDCGTVVDDLILPDETPPVGEGDE